MKAATDIANQILGFINHDLSESKFNYESNENNIEDSVMEVYQKNTHSNGMKVNSNSPAIPPVSLSVDGLLKSNVDHLPYVLDHNPLSAYKCEKDGCRKLYTSMAGLSYHYRLGSCRGKVPEGIPSYPCEVPGCIKVYKNPGISSLLIYYQAVLSIIKQKENVLKVFQRFLRADRSGQ